MIDKDKLPGSTYEELIELLGYIEADAFLEANQYNFYAVQKKILKERIKRKYGKRAWLYFWIILGLIAIVYIILNFVFIF